MRSWLKGFILSSVSAILAGAVAMVVAFVGMLAAMLAFWLVSGRVPEAPEFFLGFIFATVFWPLDRRFTAWLRTAPPAIDTHDPIENEEA